MFYCEMSDFASITKQQPCMLNYYIDFAFGSFESVLKLLTEDFTSFEGLQYTLVTVLLFYLYWSLFHRSFDLYRDFTSYGFEAASNGKESTDVKRRNRINEMRQRRKIGDLPPSYPNGWFAILESDNLENGKAIEVYALGLNLVAWRGESGKAYVADAYCPHIGAHLGVGGKVSGDCIQCPFHSWTFDGLNEGKLTRIPYSSSVPEFVKLKMWTIIETNGFIFLWYHAEKEAPTWFPDSVPEINEKKWTYRGRSEFRISCHIQEIPENGADVAHLNVLHSSAILCGDNPSVSKFSWNFIKHVWSAKWSANSDPLRSHEALLQVVHFIKLFDWLSFFFINVDIHQTGPGIVMLYFDTFFGKGILIQTVTPTEPLLQRVTHRFYSSPTFIHPLGKLVLDGEAKQIARDIRIWNRKCFINRPVLTKEDQSIKSFRRWFTQFYSENSPKHYFATNDANANKLAF